jgi:hypothetical protein
VQLPARPGGAGGGVVRWTAHRFDRTCRVGPWAGKRRFGRTALG